MERTPRRMGAGTGYSKREIQLLQASELQVAGRADEASE